MKEITILSGKGGTGKTSMTAALAAVAKNAVFCDSDVDASDLHLIFEPEIKESFPFFSGWEMHIDKEQCTDCGICLEHCRFGAITDFNDKGISINPLKCEGCRLCERVCPSQAISSTPNMTNKWCVSTSRFGPLVHAHMKPGEENSGKLVTQVRKQAKEIADAQNLDYIITDGPPGIGCSTIASLSGTDQVLLVIEPSISGFHDIKRLIALIESFNLKALAVINKYDINVEVSDQIKAYLADKDIPLLAQIPFEKEVIKALSEGKTIVEYNPQSLVTEMVKDIWKQLKV